MAQGHFFSELKRRNVYRVGAAYAVAAFALIEVVSNVAPMFDLPSWIGRTVTLLLVVGFPAVLSFAWVYEFTPDGLKRAADVEQGASLTHLTGHRLNLVIIALMVVLAGLYSADRFLLRHEATESAARTSAEGPPLVSAPGSVSIAVLPFVNLSSDPEQEFFSDGMTEEITSALAKVQSLRVVGRTSAFEFKGQNKDLRAIGQALSANHLLEGSVRKSGNRVRITAQLIKADDGTHIWTENYDRELTDIFATQDDIAQAIAGALRIPLGLKQGESLVTNRSIDAENYQQYLRAKALVRSRNNGTDRALIEPIKLLEHVVARESGYTPAWALLSQAYALGANNGAAGKSVEEIILLTKTNLPRAETAARRAVELDARSADGYAALAFTLHIRGRHEEAEDDFKRAIELDAFNPDLLHLYSLFIGATGRLQEAVTMRKQLQSLEPMVPQFNTNTVNALVAAGQGEAALATANGFPINRDSSPVIHASLGRYKEAADLISRAPADRYAPGVAEAAVRLLLMAPRTVAPEDLPDLKVLTFVYLYVGAPERTFVFTEEYAKGGLNNIGVDVWGAAFAPVRKTARFKVFVRNAGYLHYWQARGWPDLCRPLGAEDFECD